MSPVRIAALALIRSPWTRETVAGLASAGSEVHVIDFDAPRSDRVGYISPSDRGQERDVQRLRQKVEAVHLLSSAGNSVFRYARAVPEFRDVLRRIDPDVLISFYGGGFSLLSWFSGFRPYVVYVVGSDVLLLNGRVQRALARRSLERAALVLANGTFLSRQTTRLAPRATVREFLYGVDVDDFVPGPKCTDKVRIVCPRGFMQVYNNRYIVEGLASMPDPGIEYTVDFLAPGPELAEVQALADRVLPTDRRSAVRFHGGVGRDEMIRHLSTADIYVSMSRSDGTATSTLEALSSGAFPVLSDIPQNREWIMPNDGNGLLVPLDEPPALGAALRSAITEPAVRAQAVDRNRSLVMQRASARHNVAALRDLLAGIAHGAI